MASESPVCILRNWLRRKSGAQGRLNPKGLHARLMDGTGLNSVSLKEALGVLRRSGEITAVAWDEYHGIPLSKMNVNLASLEPDEHVVQWAKLVEATSFSHEGKIALADPAVANKFRDMDSSWRERLLQDLERFADNGPPAGLTVFEAGARNIMGSSKILGFLGEKLLTKLGIQLQHLSHGPRYVAVAGPANPAAVILVENPHSFETAAEARPDCAWACTYGFGLSLGKDDRDGQMLIENLTAHIESLRMLTRGGSPPSFGTLLGHRNLFFWGDLDMAGLMIFNRLRASFPHIRLSGLYEPMLATLREGGGHPYARCVGKEGQKPFSTNDPLLGLLMAQCLERGLDQEALGVDHIREYADRALDKFSNRGPRSPKIGV